MNLPLVRRSLISMAASVLVASTAAADPPIEESSQSDIRVGITVTLESFGFEIQEAHDIAVFVTDGVNLGQLQQSCMVYLITMWWCEVVNGAPEMRMIRFRVGADCLGGFFPSSGVCVVPQCPLGTMPVYKLRTHMACLGKPGNTCVFLQISGPVASTCAGVLPCGCVSELAATTCEQVFECVESAGSPPVEVPLSCPVCN